MSELLGLVLFSFIITSFFMVPFIDFLYFLRRRFKRGIPKGYDDSSTPIHNKLLQGKDIETPVGGGILIIVLVSIVFISYHLIYGLDKPAYLYIILFTFLSFAMIGLLDDVQKMLTVFSGKYAGLRGRFIFLLQAIFAILTALLLYNILGVNNLYITGVGNLLIGQWFIPLAAFMIVAFSNAYNISDGLDGLSTGLLVICLLALLALTSATLDLTLTTFIGIWLGALFAFLYFNIYPARIYLGDAGALSFGATLAVIGLLTGKIVGLAVIGGVYVIIVGSSTLQILFRKVFRRKLFPVAPIHMYLRLIGWEEPKIVMRLWLAQALFAIFGLWIALAFR